MTVRSWTIAPLLFLMSQVAFAQIPELDRFSLQVGAGSLMKSGGHTLSAAFGFSPISRVDLTRLP
jgi:hypothetical protein